MNDPFGGKQVDRNSASPLYRQVKEILLDSLTREVYRVGDTLPTEAVLQSRFKVSSITVRQALRELAAMGYVRRQAGRGTFVTRSMIEDTYSRPVGSFLQMLQEAGHQTKYQVLRFEWENSSDHIAKILKIAPQRPVLRIDRLLYADGKPVAYSQNWIKLDRVHCKFDREDLSDISIWDVLDKHTDLAFADGERILQAIGASATEAKLLGLKRNAPLMLTEITLRDRDARPVVTTRTVHVGEFYRFQTSVRR
jgi:GntR family transcriptional regulator